MTITAMLRAGIAAAAVLMVGATAIAQPLRDVTFAVGTGGFGTAPVRLSKELGLFERHGINPKLSIMESGNTAESAVISRSVDFGLAGPGEIVPAVARGQKVVIIANSYSGFSISMVLAKSVADKLGVSPDAPLMDRIKALDGLLIAAPSATSSSTFVFKTLARQAGANIRLTFMDLGAMPAALASGAVQGYLSSAPFWAFPIIKGTGVLWVSGPRGDVPYELRPASSSSVQTMRAFAQANPELVKQVAAVFADLVKALEDRPAEVKAALAKVYPDLDAQTLDLLFNAESSAWKAKALTPKDIAHEIAFIKASGVAIPNTADVDPASFLFP
jgi:ABC-type nitrate/sulfonate/bicarbonate transport system substrate-binding protein